MPAWSKRWVPAAPGALPQQSSLKRGSPYHQPTNHADRRHRDYLRIIVSNHISGTCRRCDFNDSHLTRLNRAAARLTPLGGVPAYS